MTSEKVAVIMGSDSDLPVVDETIKTLSVFEIETKIFVISAHRTPDLAIEFAKTAKQEGFSVLIAAASLAAHLAGILASSTILPVIGLPICSTFCSGLDSLLSTVQMPSGVPVATVAVNGAKNAALLAVQILAIKNLNLSEKLEKFKAEMVKNVLEKNKILKYDKN